MKSLLNEVESSDESRAPCAIWRKRRHSRRVRGSRLPTPPLVFRKLLPGSIAQGQSLAEPNCGGDEARAAGCDARSCSSSSPCILHVARSVARFRSPMTMTMTFPPVLRIVEQARRQRARTTPCTRELIIRGATVTFATATLFHLNSNINLIV